jgi:hypothetical protein
MLGGGISPTAKTGGWSGLSRSYLKEFGKFEKIFLKKKSG